MPLNQREALAANMDVTLIEKQKVESMKTFFEINNVIQMSFIEMQYMKKEMLNALEAIDQMMSGEYTAPWFIAIFHCLTLPAACQTLAVASE